MIHPDIHLYHADMMRALRLLPDNCIDSCVTDPPYHLTSVVKRFGGANAAPAQFGTDGLFARQSRGFMQREWDGGDIAFRHETWSEVLRVLKPGGHVCAFGASRGYHRMACAIEDAGFEIRDSLMWVYATGFPKSMNVGVAIDKAERGVPQGGADPTSPNHGKFKSGCSDENKSGRGFGAGPGQFMAEAGTKIERELCEAAQPWSGFGTALKPAFEPIVLARKPLSELTVAANVLRWRTGALNIDACRVEATDSQLAEKYASVQNAGPRENSIYGTDNRDRAGSAPHAAGRWPANVVLSFPSDTYRLCNNVTAEQRTELEAWIAANA